MDTELPTLPLKINVAGHHLPLHVTSFRAECGNIEDGISFEFGDQGGWVVPLEEIESLCVAARVARKRLDELAAAQKGSQP